MYLPQYKLIGEPKRYKNGRGKRAKNYIQKFRILSDPTRKYRSVSLGTKDVSVARSRAKKFVEDRLKSLTVAADPLLKTKTVEIKKTLSEYTASLENDGNTPKHVAQIGFRITKIIDQAGFTMYSEIDNARAKNAVCEVQKSGQFKTNSTANKYLEAIQAWTKWMYENGRWDSDPLDRPFKSGANNRKQFRTIKGDTRNSRPRTILTQQEFDRLLVSTRKQKVIRNLTGEKRFWLYLIVSQTGLRASEVNSLSPSNFHLEANHPFIEIQNTVSKRGKQTGKKDQIHLNHEFTKHIRPWLNTFDSKQRLFGESHSWHYKAASILRSDLVAAELPTEKVTSRGRCVIDFHSFRGMMITNALKTNKPQHVAMKIGRLSDQRLLKSYLTISDEELIDCVNAMPVPNIDSLASNPRKAS